MDQNGNGVKILPLRRRYVESCTGRQNFFNVLLPCLVVDIHYNSGTEFKLSRTCWNHLFVL
jgi:hypothetical protein